MFRPLPSPPPTHPSHRNQCNSELQRNYAEHERLFEKAKTPSDESIRNSAHSLNLNNKINNNNNHFYSGENTKLNPLRPFLGPQQYDEVGTSTIEKLSRRLESFYGKPNDTELDLESSHDKTMLEFNNNPSELNDSIALLPDPDDEPSTTLSLINNNNNNEVSYQNQLFEHQSTDNAFAKTNNVPTTTTITNNAEDDQPWIEAKKKKVKSKVTTNDPPPPIAINNMNNHLSLLGHIKPTPPTPNAVRKNTPADLPMIIKQAIEHKDGNVAVRRGKFQKVMTLNIGLANLPPPETPLIESAPQSIDFANQSLASTEPPTNESNPQTVDDHLELLEQPEAAVTIAETESDFNKAINAMHYEDAFEEKLAHALDANSTKFEVEPEEDEDNDDNGSEFTSANYWYIKPELPLLDLDLIQHEVNSLQHQFNSITVDDIYNESMHEMKSTAQDLCPQDNGWQSQIAKLQRNGGLHMHRLGNVRYRQDIVPGFLVRYFVSMVQFHDPDMNMHCVYNFPGVALTLGPRYWHLARDLLLELCEDLEWKNRKTVAMFIYQIGLIIGREMSGKDLVPIFMGFFKDLDEVKIEALRNITNFLQIVDIEHHHKIIFRLGCCLNTDNYANWRFREELAQQVLNLFEMYGNTYNIDGMIYLTGIALNLLSDDVCSVRDIALNAVSKEGFL